MCNPKVVSLASCFEHFTLCDNEQLWKVPIFQSFFVRNSRSLKFRFFFWKLKYSTIDKNLSVTLSHKPNSKKDITSTAMEYHRNYSLNHNYEILKEFPSSFRFNLHSIQSTHLNYVTYFISYEILTLSIFCSQIQSVAIKKTVASWLVMLAAVESFIKNKLKCTFDALNATHVAFQKTYSY